MDNPDEAKTTINVKAVSAKAWERARNCAGKHDETMGEWLSRAINRLADLEEHGTTVEPPANPEKPVRGFSAAPEAVAEMARGMAVLAQATGVMPAKRDVRRVYGLMDEIVRAARGMPPRPLPSPGKANGKALPKIGKAIAAEAEEGA